MNKKLHGCEYMRNHSVSQIYLGELWLEIVEVSLSQKLARG